MGVHRKFPKFPEKFRKNRKIPEKVRKMQVTYQIKALRKMVHMDIGHMEIPEFQIIPEKFLKNSRKIPEKIA